MKLPRNRREFCLFLLVVSVLSVIIIAPLISCFEMGFSLNTWKHTFEVIPYIWIVVVLFVLLTHTPSSKITSLLLSKKDSFNAHIIINCLINVMMMSILLTVVASWIGMRSISWLPIEQFFYKWPRNFTIAFLVEVLIAQPLARRILLKKHLVEEKKKTSKAR